MERLDKFRNKCPTFIWIPEKRHNIQCKGKLLLLEDNGEDCVYKCDSCGAKVSVSRYITNYERAK